jgi:hypothetical protein
MTCTKLYAFAPRTALGAAPRALLAALLAAAALAAPLAVAGDVEIDRTLEMPADGLVFVENVAGKVEFIAWDRAEVQIRGEAGDSVEEVEITSSSTGVRVRVINRKGQRRIDGTDLYLRVPRWPASKRRP